MKVITENALISIQRKAKTIMEKTVLNIAIANCQEIDTLTVSKLRPMCEAETHKTYLVKHDSMNALAEAYIDTFRKAWIGGICYELNELEGFIPMPVYKPEK